MDKIKQKVDLKKPKDIHRVVNAFFEKVKKDALLAPYFADKNVLLYSGGYFGNPMARHKEMHELHAFTEAHFEQWLQLFTESVDRLYAGPNAEMMKERARNIATVMQVKIAQ